MKKILLTLFALGIATMALAQTNQAPAANAVLVSQTRSGNTIVSRYKIPHDGKHAEFDLYYAKSHSDIAPSFSENPQQIAELKSFMEQTKDTAMHISAIHIVGYASPDGNSTKNDSLASKRAQSLYHYAVNTYHPVNKIDTSHKTFHWSDCVSAINNSKLTQKEAVVEILTSTSHSEAQKEVALRRIPEAWDYLTTRVLPQMRYADIEFDYGVDEYVTRTTTVAPAESAKPVQPTPQSEVVVDEEVGIIVATPKEGSAHHNEKGSDRKSRKGRRRLYDSEYEVIYW